MPTALDETLRTLTSRLLAERTPAGHWEGHLASSALATATAIGALSLAGREHAEAVRRGVAWLVAHQNAEGGWGDTPECLSNISTTALAWAACSLAAEHGARTTMGGVQSAAGMEAASIADATRRAEEWLRRAAGGLDPATLVEAIVRRYGKDRTFSVPILTVLAIAGKLGDGAAAWRRVPQLPFELAACPHQWFQWLRLPVVSYALPALIAIGQVRHRRCPTRNPLTRVVRNATRATTLRTLTAIQPSSGGFLEATPLTAFVVMSLVASGETHHPVVTRGVQFLRASQRDDGSWPIDTNLATWVTTLSIAALAGGRESHGQDDPLAALDRDALTRWLLRQQYRVEHPYTHAAPGGWAWTDLPGGVPDADDTPGALVALSHLRIRADDDALAAARLGIRWLLDLQNRDGGIPTFCRGWGALPFDRSSPDLTAHTLLAWEAWHGSLPTDLAGRVSAATDRAVAFLSRAQRADGAWVPLWFGREHAPEQENPTYGTSRVLIALSALIDRPWCHTLAARGSAWLLAAQNQDGGWGGAPGVSSSIEETSLAVHALAALATADDTAARRSAMIRGVDWLIEATRRGTHTPASPIGLYFAKLWYDERLYPLIFAAAALGRARQAISAARPAS